MDELTPCAVASIDHLGTPRHLGQLLVRGWRSSWFRLARLFCALLLSCLVCSYKSVIAQGVDDKAENPVATQAPVGDPETPGKVEVEPVAEDDDIGQRIEDILEATGWFGGPNVIVKEGIVFLKGTAQNEGHRKWAGDLGRNTEGVVAVVNQIEVAPGAIWNFDPTIQELNHFARGIVRSLPLIVMAIVVIAISLVFAKLTVHVLRRSLLAQTNSQLLREVTALAGGILVMLAGLYLVLRIAGLAQLALTVLGGTGLIGLVLGIAFRDITENFLASLFLSLQQPFRAGDLVEVASVTGFVQRLTSRTTVLTTLDGNQVQVPNSTVFKSTIRNFTSNPNRRVDFAVGIGYEDSISFAQEAALKVLAEHPAVLDDPEPLVLVEGLGSSAVNLRVYFWLDGAQHSLLKVKSSVIRLVKRAYQEAGISLPDEAREVTFPYGVPIRMISGDEAVESAKIELPKPTAEPDTISTKAEAGLQSEAEEIKKQARKAWTPGENLLTPSPSADANANANAPKDAPIDGT